MTQLISDMSIMINGHLNDLQPKIAIQDSSRNVEMNNSLHIFRDEFGHPLRTRLGILIDVV